MIINIGDTIEDKKGRQGEIVNIGIATEKSDVAAENDTSLNAQTYDTELNYMGAITFGSNWCYFHQIEKIVKEIHDYIKGTYGEHYSTTKDGFQVQDMLRHLNIDKDFCQANAIKYLCRFGKKAGRNRKDLLKAVHYIVLLMSSEDKK